jgi:hypothetical protein
VVVVKIRGAGLGGGGFEQGIRKCVRSYWDRDACEEKGKNETDEQAFT